MRTAPKPPASTRIEHSFFIAGKIPGKKNNKFLARGRLITDPEIQKRLQAVTHEIWLVHWSRLPALTDAEVEMEFHLSALNGDLDNKLTSVIDCLKDAGVLVNDSAKHLRKIGASFVLVKRGDEGVDVFVSGVEAKRKVRAAA